LAGTHGVTLRDLLTAERRREARGFGAAAALAALVGSASVLLLGLSGWFISGAAMAGLAGPLAAQGFNYLLPSVGIRALAIARTGARYGERLCSHAAALKGMARIRGQIFHIIAHGPAALGIGAGEVTSRIVQDITVVEGALVRRSTGWGLAASATSGLALIAFAGRAALAWTLSCLVVLLIAATIVARRSEGLAGDVQTRAGLLKQEFVELAAARAELRCYGLEEWAGDRMATRGYAFGEAQRTLTAASGLHDAFQAALLALAAAGTIVLAAPAGPAIAALAALAAAMAVEGAGPFVRHIAAGASVRAAEQRLNGLLTSQGPALPSIRGTAQPRLRLPGTGRIGIVGPSGCGKTTLVERIVGLRPLPYGLIYLGDEDLATRTPLERRGLFAWCPQDAMLPTGTVRDALRMSAPAADEAALWSALRDAVIEERVRFLGGLDVWIGEDGVRLSGGERRRLALARALVAEARWLLLDEPTEGLDAGTEELLVERIDLRLRRKAQGLLLVSHRAMPLTLCETVLPAVAEASAGLAA
jgi:ATP-binding cassette subfamily C protein CydC